MRNTLDAEQRGRVLRKLASVGMVFAGLMAIMSAIALLSASSISLGSGASVASAVLGLVPPAASALFGVYLIYSRDSLAQRWFADEPLDLTVDALPLLRLGLILLGLTLAIRAAGEVATMMVFAITPGFSSGWSSLAGALVSLVAGCILLMRSEAISEFLWRIGASRTSRV